VGITEEKARHGGAYRDGRGSGGPAVGSVFGAGGAAHRRPWAAGGGCLAGGGWRLRGVEVEDELQALDFVSNGCKID
jgi:hypothetical protein